MVCNEARSLFKDIDAYLVVIIESNNDIFIRFVLVMQFIESIRSKHFYRNYFIRNQLALPKNWLEKKLNAESRR